MKKLSESIFGNMSDKGRGEVVKKEDDVNLLDLNEFYEYVKDRYKTKVEYIDLDAMGGGNGDVLGVDITEDIILFYKPKRGHILLSWSKVKIPMPFFDELADRFKIENPNAMRRIITEKDGTCTNQTFIDVIDYFLEYNKIFIENIKESLFGNMTDKGRGETIKKEDDVNHLDLGEFFTYLTDHYKVDNCGSDFEITDGDTIFIPFCTAGERNIKLGAIYWGYKYGYSENGYVAYIHHSIFPYVAHLDKKLDENFDLQDSGKWVIINPKDSNKEVNNTYFLELLNFIIDNLDSKATPVIFRKTNESLFGNMSDKGRGETIKKEDDVNHLDKDDFYDYIKSHYEFTEYETKFTCGYELIAIPLFTTPYSLRYTLLNVPEHRVEMYESLFEKWPTDLQTVLREKYNVESVENERGDIMTYITQKDDESDNKFLLDFIDTIINNVEKPVIRRITNESIFGNMTDKGRGETIKKEDERHKILERLLATYIKLFADSCYYHDEYTSGSYPDFRAYIKDFRDNPRIEEVCPDDSYFDDLLNYVNRETWDNQIDDTIMEMTDRIDKGEHLITDDVIEELRKHNVNESLFGNMADKGRGETIKKEDEITEDELKQIDQYISDYGNEVVLDWGRGSDACNLDEFIDYLKTDRKVNDRILKYVKDNWFGEICDGVDASIEQTQEEYNQDMNESIFGNMSDKGRGETVKKEDEMTQDDFVVLIATARMFLVGVRNYSIPKNRKYVPKRIDGQEGFIDYILERKKEHFWSDTPDGVYDKMIKFVKDNWGDCTGIQDFMDKYLSNINECDGVPGGLTPADVGGMGAAYFPGPNGEPGSGDLPSPTGVVYHQVAPYTMFLKDIKKKKKKKKFRIEDEPCAHSKNSKAYDYVDDFREYVDRTYNNIDKRK